MQDACAALCVGDRDPCWLVACSDHDHGGSYVLLQYGRDRPDPDVEDRPFVAWPLLELDPELSLPDGRPSRELAERLPRDGMVELPELTAQLRAEVRRG
jgi:hypothetical protein